MIIFKFILIFNEFKKLNISYIFFKLIVIWYDVYIEITTPT